MWPSSLSTLLDTRVAFGYPLGPNLDQMGRVFRGGRGRALASTMHSYDSRHDMIDPAIYGPQASTSVVTVLIYLSAPGEGGETIFPLQSSMALKPLNELRSNIVIADLRMLPGVETR